jgi:hypothetical protein
MNNGIYEYEYCSNPYDTGTLVVEVKETEKSLQLKVIEKDMRYSTYVDVLFGDKDKVSINKQRSPHNITCGNGWFIVYPNRMGKPLSFIKKGGAE